MGGGCSGCVWGRFLLLIGRAGRGRGVGVVERGEEGVEFGVSLLFAICRGGGGVGAVGTWFAEYA